MSNYDRDEELERERRRARWGGYSGGGASERAPGVPGRTSLASQLPAGSNGPYRGATLAFDAPELDDADVHVAARAGVSGSGSTLPHLDAIQRSFGHHDVGGVRAFVGGAAATASDEIGASAYATGDDVAFAAAPDLRLAAHEAAHVVQQRGGVRLAGGVGREGDVYERHADAVADLVVRGESAQSLLDQMAHRGASGGPAVQRNPGDRIRARLLRRSLERRLGELDHDHERSEARVAFEREQITHALAELDAAGPTPSHELVMRLTREDHARTLARTADHEPVTLPEGPDSPTADAEDAARDARTTEPDPTLVVPTGRSAPAADEDDSTFASTRPEPSAGRDTSATDRTAPTLDAFERPSDRVRLGVLRTRLERRLDELDSDHERSRARVDVERDQVTDALAELDAAGPAPPHDLIVRLTREHDARVRARAADHEPTTLPEGRGSPTADAFDRADRRVATARSALRDELLRRAEDDSADESSRTLARLALADLAEAGPEASMEELHRIAETLGIDLADVAARAGEHAHTDVSVSLGTVGVTHHDGTGSSTGASATVTQSGGSIEVSHESAGGHERSLGAGFSLHHSGDGITGADATLSGGYGAFSGELTGGVTYYADRPQRQPDGSYRVSWRLAARIGLEVSRRLGSTGMRGGLGGSGEITREGTDVFTGSTPDEALRSARDFQESFRTLDIDEIVRRFERLASRDLGSADWWRSTAPVGTERRVELAGTLTPVLSARVCEVASLGLGAEIERADSGKVKKTAETTVECEEEFHVGGHVEPTVGSFGISVSGLAMSGVPTRGRHKVTFTYRVDMDQGAEAFEHFLAQRHLEGNEEGVRLTGHEVEDEIGEGAGVRLGPVGHIDGSDVTSTTTATEYAEDGTASERVTHHARQQMTGNTITGAYTHRGMTVDAPEADGAYVATTDIHSTDGAESREMLGAETGTHGLSTDPATSSGHWVIREEMSQAEMREFHRRFIEHDASTMVMGTAYSRLYDRLRAIPTDASGDARRAAAITDFLSVEGRRGLDAIEATGGFEVEQSLRLFGRDGEDMNFLSLTTLHQIEARIADYRSAAAEGRLDGLADRIRGDITLLEGPLAAVSDVTRYTDLPGELRERVCGRYSGLLDQLRATMSLVDDSYASGYSTEAQGVYRLVQEERELVTHERSDTTEVRSRVIEFRRYYGQAPGHREGTLDAAARDTTEAHWLSAESAFQEAERSVEEANDRLAAARGASELSAELRYQEARADLEHALFEYRQAHAQLDELVSMYSRATTAATTSGTTSTTDTVSASETAPATETAPTAEPVAVASPTTTHHGRTRRDSEHADHTSVAPTPETTSSEPRGGIVLAAYLAPHIHRDGSAFTGVATVDRGPARMPSGLVVELLSALGVSAPDLMSSDVLGDRWLFNVELRIVTALPGATAFLVPQLNGHLINNETITNRVGETFRVVVAC